MPSILIVHGYRIYFWSNELGEPIHVHIAKGNPSRNATKVWLTKAGGCVLAHNDGRIPSRDLRELMDIVSANHARIADAWCRFSTWIRRAISAKSNIALKGIRAE